MQTIAPRIGNEILQPSTRSSLMKVAHEAAICNKSTKSIANDPPLALNDEV